MNTVIRKARQAAKGMPAALIIRDAARFDKSYFNTDELAFIDDAMWSRSGNEITVTLDDESIVLTILELTDNTLILALTVTETDIELEEDIKLTYTYNFTFIKQ